ncbi:MAG: TetR/AcrR family transcriptional regulator [Bdellovibrionota bacterium]
MKNPKAMVRNTPILFPQRKQQADATRERLVELAWKQVRREGIQDFKILTLAKKAGVASGLPYVYFDSREKFLDELRIRAWDELEKAVDEKVLPRPPLKTTADYENNYRKVIHAIADYAAKEPRLVQLVLLTPGVEQSPAVLERSVRASQKFMGPLLEGIREGALEARGDPLVFALALWTAVQGHIQRSTAQAAPMFKKIQSQVLDEILEIFFSYIRPRRKP